MMSGPGRGELKISDSSTPKTSSRDVRRPLHGIDVEGLTLPPHASVPPHQGIPYL